MEILKEEEIKKLDKIAHLLSDEELRVYSFSKGYYDIEFFSDYFLPHWKMKDKEFIETPFFHKEIWEALDGKENINIIIPRGHGKTTAILIWILHALIYEKHKFILYVASSSLGEEGIGKIKQELVENEEIIQVFGVLSPELHSTRKDKQGRKWRQKELELLNGCKIQTLSKGQGLRGKRCTKIIVDDPQENKDVENKEVTDKFNTWFFSALYNTMLPGYSMCVVGTMIGNMCIVKYLRDEKNWKTIEYKAIEDGNVLWPDLWDLESLEERRKIIGTLLFNQEFLNIPLSKEDTLIKQHFIRYYPAQFLHTYKFDKIVMAVDPAVSIKEKSDYTGICIIGNIGDKKYVLLSEHVKLTPNNLELHIISRFNQFGPNVIVQEENIEAKLLEDLKRKGLPIKGVRATKDKFTRLLGVAGLLEAGIVYFRKNTDHNISMDEVLIEQLTSFPDTKHDDIMDAFVYALTYFGNNESSNQEIYIIR